MNLSRTRALGLLVVAGAAVAAGCGGGGGGSKSDDAVSATGPIQIWYSNNPEEVKWGKSVVASWNAAHADQKVTGREIPAGKTSEEVIGASITAGNTPCLVFNTSPAAVPGWVKEGGMVPLDDFSDGRDYVNARTGDRAKQYESSDGKLYQLPWKTNPVMIFYNKDVFKKAGLNADNPPLKTYSQFISTAQTLVQKGGVKAAIWPAPSSEFFQPWFDFYPLFIAQSGGKQLVEDGKPTFDSPAGRAAANFWSTLYKDGLAPKEKYNGDSFADKKAAMAIVGPWAIAVYGSKINWGAVPVPTKDGMAANDVHTFSDEKSIGMFSACKNRGTAWAFAKFATSKTNDGKLLQVTGQMPMRTALPTTFATYFKTHPDYKTFADQAARTVEVPNVPNSVEMWQDFRDAYSKNVIFSQGPDSWLKDTASKIQPLVSSGE
jgi:multiple sugar transport system substrate-binding protein